MYPVYRSVAHVALSPHSGGGNGRAATLNVVDYLIKTDVSVCPMYSLSYTRRILKRIVLGFAKTSPSVLLRNSLAQCWYVLIARGISRTDAISRFTYPSAYLDLNFVAEHFVDECCSFPRGADEALP